MSLQNMSMFVCFKCYNNLTIVHKLLNNKDEMINQMKCMTLWKSWIPINLSALTSTNF